MKVKKWPYVLLIILCLGIFAAYRYFYQFRADTLPPEITVDSQQLTLSVQDNRGAMLRGVTAWDGVDGDVTASLLVENVQLLDTDGNITITYAAFDSAGNVAKAQREARYTDYESPRFTLSSPLVFTQNSNFDVLEVLGAWDPVDGDIQHRIRATSLDASSISTVGNHRIQFRVTNSLGDTVERVFPVEVQVAGTHDGSLTLTDYLIYLPVGANFQAENYLNTFTLNQESTSLKYRVSEEYSLRTTGRVDTSTPGVYSVAYTVTYTPEVEQTPYTNRNNQNQTVKRYTAYSKLIVVVEE